MKRVSNKLFAYFSILVMVLGFFLPNFNYVVKATEGKEESHELFGAVINNTVYLDMDSNTKVDITSTENIQSIDYCYSTDTIIGVTYSDNKCIVESKSYGKTILYLDYKNLDGVSQTEVITVDVDFDNYVNTLYERLPDVYEYKKGEDFHTYLNDLMPSNANVYPTGELSDECYYIESDKCDVELSVSYYSYNKETNSSEYLVEKRTKHIKKVDEIKEDNGFYYIPTQYVAVGESIKPDIQAAGVSTDYFFVSEDNTIARIDESNQLVGVSPGNTNIRIVNKNTLEYTTFSVVVDSAYQTKSLKEVLEVFKDTVTIDITNNKNIYYGYNETGMIGRYFDAIAKNIKGNINSINVRNSTCADVINLQDCQVEYYYYGNNGEISGTTQVFDVELRGVRATSPGGFYHTASNGYYYYKDEIITINDILNFESDLLYSVDEEYLEVIEEDDTVKFKTKKEGFTKITLYTTSGYMSTISINILFSRDEVEDLRNYIDNIRELNVPYNKTDNNDENIKDHIITYIEDSYSNKRLLNYLDAVVTILPNGDASTTVKLKSNNQELFNLVYDRVIKINYASNDNAEVLNNLKDFKNQIKDKYAVSLDKSISLLNSTKNLTKFYQDLYHHSELAEDISYEGFSIRVEFTDSIKQNNYLIGGAYYTIYIYANNELVGSDQSIVLCSQTIDRDIEDTEKDALTYIDDYIYEQIGERLNVQHAFDNYYMVDIGDINIYLLYDHKKKVIANNVDVYNRNAAIIQLETGEQKKFNYTFTPFTATYFDLKMASSDEDILKVDKYGNMVGISSGLAYISYSNGYFPEKHPVLVDIPINEYLDSILEKMNLQDIKVDYGVLEWGYEEALQWAVERELWAYEEKYGQLHFTPEVIVNENNKELEITLCIEGVCSSEYKGKYHLVGIYNGQDTRNYRIKVNETINSNIKFTEASISNLRFVVGDESIATVDKKGNITGHKKGITTLSVFDKYHEYLNEYYIYVDYEKYIEEMLEDVTSTTYKIDGYKSNSYLNLEYEIINQVIDQINAMGYDFYGTIAMHYYESSYDSETGILTITFGDGGEGAREFSVQTELVGIHLHNYTIPLELGDTYVDKYKAYTEGTITLISSNNNICTVEGTTVSAVGKGVCQVTYQLGEYKDIQNFIVDSEGLKNDLNIMIEDIPDELEIPLDPYDTDKRTDYRYSGYYDTYIYDYLQKLYPEGGNYYATASSINMSDNGDEVSINLSYQDNVFEYGSYRMNHIVASDSKKIKLVFTNHSEGWEEEGERILSNVKEEYILTPEQMMDYTFSSGNLGELHEYSSFIDDIEKTCSDCRILLGGRGGVDGGNGVVNIGFEYYILKNNEPIAVGDVMIYGYLYLDLLEVEDDKHIEREVKERFKEAYKKHRHHRMLYSSLTRFKADESEIVTEDDFEVELTLTSKEGNLYNYDVEIEGNKYQTSVYLNILTKDLQYDNNIQDIIVNNTLLNLHVGESEQIEITINPTDTTERVIWKSSNEQVAKVVDGKVIALSYGSAIITVESESGDVKKTIYVSVIGYKLPGDIDGDGKVNIVDLVKLRKHLAKIEELTGDPYKGADFNKDGTVNIKDLVNMRQHLAK